MTTLAIKKNAPIQSGEIRIEYLPDSERLYYAGHVKLKLGFFSKKVPFDKRESVPRDLMKSASLTEGSTIEFKGISVFVISNDGLVATVSFDSDDVSGTALLDVSAEYLDVLSLKAKSEVQGIKLKIEAYKV